MNDLQKWEDNSMKSVKTLLSKSDFIITECADFINVIRKSLSHLLAFRSELNKGFVENKEITVRLDNVFREIEPLNLLYKIINDKMKMMRRRTPFYLPDLFLDKEIRASLIFHKSFLSHYAANAKWIGQFHKTDPICQEACNRAVIYMQLDTTVNLENCLYTIFNSLFAFELMFDRYSKCFEATHISRIKAEEVVAIIRDILQQSSDVQNQESFFRTQKELNLLNGKSGLPRINSEFILKDLAVKYSRKDNKELSRQLVLFSDGLYVTTPPGSINGTSRVCLELSFKSMEVNIIPEDEIRHSNTKWGLNINALEANKDFYFDDEKKLMLWKSKLELSIKNENKDLSNNPNINATQFATLGQVAPEWQRDSMAKYCNGLRCSIRFTPRIRRHHCRADGLLYCDSCTSYKIKLPFDKIPESRICELCFRILCRDLHNSSSTEEAKKQLNMVFERKTRKGIKLNWLDVRIYNSDKVSFNSPNQFFCELDESHPFLKLYKKFEDKIRHRDIILLGMSIRTGSDSKYSKMLKPSQFTIEHQDRVEAYLFKASSAENCKEWVQCLRESIQKYCNE